MSHVKNDFSILEKMKTAGGASNKKSQRSNSQSEEQNRRTKYPAQTGFSLSGDTSLHRHAAIASIELMHKRPDLQKLLAKHRQKLSTLPVRLRSYFKQLGLLDAEQQITPLGEEFINLGELAIAEKGLFHISYASHPLLGHKTVALQRIDAFKQSVDGEVLARAGEAKLEDFRTGERVPLKLYDPQGECWSDEYCHIKSIDVLSCAIDQVPAELVWKVEGGNHVELSASINIEREHGRQKPLPFNIQLPAFVGSDNQAWHSLADELGGSWQAERHALALPLSELIDRFDVLNSCALRSLPVQTLNVHGLGDFNIKGFNSLGIEPLTGEGDFWLKSWLKHYFSQAPVSPLQAEKAQSAWRSKEQLRHCDIPPLGHYEVLQLLQERGRGKAFWNATSTVDLVPAQPVDIGLPLTLIDGDNTTPIELLHALTGGLPLERIVISDRYYRTGPQQALLHALDHCSAAYSHLLLTCKDGQNKALPEGWEVEYFERKLPENHDRYWLLFTVSGLKSWKVSSSLDFMRKQGGQWCVSGNPSFTPMGSNDLPKFLQSLLSREEASPCV